MSDSFWHTIKITFLFQMRFAFVVREIYVWLFDTDQINDVEVFNSISKISRRIARYWQILFSWNVESEKISLDITYIKQSLFKSQT